MRRLVPGEGRAAEGRCLTAQFRANTPRNNALIEVEGPESTAAGPGKTSTAALSVIMLSGLRPAAAPSPAGRPGGPGEDLSTSNPVAALGLRQAARNGGRAPRHHIEGTHS